MKSFIRVIYDYEGGKERATKIYELYNKIDKALVGKTASMIIFSREIYKINNAINKANLKNMDIIFSSQFSYSTPPEGINSNLENNYITDQILIEANNDEGVDPMLIPLNSGNKESSRSLLSLGLLSFGTHITFLKKAYAENKEEKFELEDLMELISQQCSRKEEKSQETFLSFTMIEIGTKSLRTFKSSIVRNTRKTMTIKSFCEDNQRIAPIEIYERMMSIRYILTSESYDIFNTPFFPSQIFIRLPTAKKIDLTKNQQLYAIIKRANLDCLKIKQIDKFLQCIR